MHSDDLEPLKARGAEIYRQYVELKSQPGGRLLGLCPFHGEKTPSFTVFADGGWKCFGCDLAGDVFAFVRRIDGCTFPEAKQRVGERLGLVQSHNGAQSNGRPANPPAAQVEQAAKAEAEPRPVAWYPYVDEAGELLFEVVRFEPGRNGKSKDFRQRRPDGKGGWIPSLDDVRRPLYRLPKVLASAAVFVVEGEKDVQTLEALGNLVATTNAGGSSQAWRDEWTEALRGKTVTIIPDKDEPGARHAAKVRDALTGAAALVAVLELPGPCKDVTEWVAAGGTKDELHRLTREAVDRARAESMPWWERVGSLDDLKYKPVEYAVGGLIPLGSLCMMAGKPGAYKSFVALDLARCIAEGRAFAGAYGCTAREVMYIDLENPQNIVASRKKTLGIGKVPKLRYLGRWSEVRFAGIDSQDIRDYAKAVKPVLFFDSLIRFHSSDENDNSEMGRVMACFMELAALGATVIVLHHAAKGEGKGARGAIEIEAAPDVSYQFDRLAESQVKIKGTKNRLAPEVTFELELQQGGFRLLTATEIAQPDDEAAGLWDANG